jgi:hypothetical protein
MRITIKRDHTFEFDGQRFAVAYGGPGSGYEVYAENEWSSNTDLETHNTMRELRAELQRRADAGQPIRILLPGDRMDLAGRIWRNGEVVA